ncbi:MAG: flagellar protein FlaG [Treponema sp.]|nr:flagellar protein FlaG [Treponema sp.]
MGIQINVAGKVVSQQKSLLPQEVSRRGYIQSSLPENRESSGNNTMDIKAVASELEHISLAFNKKLKFEVDHWSHEIVVKVLDPETDKVIKVLPPEELRRLRDKIKEVIGSLFDERI